MIVIPMAGMSARFFDAGYTLPKYQLHLWGDTVFAHAVRSFEAAFAHEHFVFVTRTDFGALAFVEREVLRLGIHRYTIVPLESPTRGQAETVMLGLQGTDGGTGPLTIFNIDSFRYGFEHPGFAAECDGYLEVFHGEGTHWSFVDPGPDGQVLRTTEKDRISSLCSDGLYVFRDAGTYRRAFAGAIEQGLWVRGEIYVAPLYNVLIREGMDIRYRLIEAGQIDFCGTPDEYRALQSRVPPVRRD